MSCFAICLVLLGIWNMFFSEKKAPYCFFLLSLTIIWVYVVLSVIFAIYVIILPYDVINKDLLCTVLASMLIFLFIMVVICIVSYVDAPKTKTIKKNNNFIFCGIFYLTLIISLVPLYLQLQYNVFPSMNKVNVEVCD
jgi:hypothetical protein